MSLRGERLDHGSMIATVDTEHYGYRRFTRKGSGLAIEGNLPLSHSTESIFFNNAHPSASVR
jgi:hypothetical protein